MVPLRGVVVDDVEDHLDPGSVEGLHEPLELTHLLPAPARRRIERVRGEEPDRRVAPVVDEAALGEEVLVGDVVDRQQLDRSHAERREMRDRGVGRHAGVRAAEVLGDVREALREALHVNLVDDRVRPRRQRRLVVLPVEGVVDDDALRDRVRVVLVVALEVGVWPARRDVRQRARNPMVDRAVDRLRVRVDQELRRVEAVTALGCPGAVHAVGVPLARPDPGEVAVPDVSRALFQRHAGLAVLVVEQAELDALGVLREEREVRAVTVPRRPERERTAGPGDAHASSGTSHTTPSGGSVTSPENGWSCHGVSSAITRPRLPIPDPPYSVASVFSTSRHAPGCGNAAR